MQIGRPRRRQTAGACQSFHRRPSRRRHRGVTEMCGAASGRPRPRKHETHSLTIASTSSVDAAADEGLLARGKVKSLREPSAEVNRLGSFDPDTHDHDAGTVGPHRRRAFTRASSHRSVTVTAPLPEALGLGRWLEPEPPRGTKRRQSSYCRSASLRLPSATCARSPPGVRSRAAVHRRLRSSRAGSPCRTGLCGPAHNTARSSA